LTRDELFSFMEDFDNRALALMKAKSADYAAGDDPFRNFRRHGTFGILVRLNDKLARLESFEQNGKFQVADEKYEDTCMDISVYAKLLLAMHKEKEK
jgi:hypothetical protein